MSAIKTQDRSTSKWIIFGLVCLCVLVFQGLTFVVVTASVSEWQVRGQLGDLFGITNSLFSGMAFAGVIFTMLLQQDQITNQQEEATQERDEARRSLETQAQANSLTVLTFLLAHYEKRLASLEGEVVTGPSAADLIERRRIIGERRGMLENILSDLHNDVVSHFGGLDVRKRSDRPAAE